MTQQINEAELQAYVDGRLEPSRHEEMERWLAANPEHAARAAAYQRQNDALHALFDPVLDEPVPARMQPAQRSHWFAAPLMRYAAVVAWVALGGMLGWALHGAQAQRPAAGLAFAQQAALAHVVYTPEVRHPVEVGADQEAHLVAWLSKRLGHNVKVPHLGEAGYELMGGRLLPGSSGPAAQFMYQDAHGQRLTLYVRTDAVANAETAFRYAHENNLGVFYWMDGAFGYALSGELGKAELLQVAQLVYRQLNP